MPEIYGLCDPETREVRYVGKANNAEHRFRQHLTAAKRGRTPVYCWMRSLPTAPVLVILERCPEDQWEERERHHIKALRASGRLLNVADGGDQPKRGTDELSQKVWRLKNMCRSNLRLFRRLGNAELEQLTLARMRTMADRLPHLFGEWANVA